MATEVGTRATAAIVATATMKAIVQEGTGSADVLHLREIDRQQPVPVLRRGDIQAAEFQVDLRRA